MFFLFYSSLILGFSRNFKFVHWSFTGKSQSGIHSWKLLIERMMFWWYYWKSRSKLGIMSMSINIKPNDTNRFWPFFSFSFCVNWEMLRINLSLSYCCLQVWWHTEILTLPRRCLLRHGLNTHHIKESIV